jgi:hypothetical protein
MTNTFPDNGLTRILRIGIPLALVPAIGGALLWIICLSAPSLGSDAVIIASTLLSVWATLTGLVCIAAVLKKRVRVRPGRLVALAFAFLACIPQFFFSALAYGLAQMHALSNLLLAGAVVSGILLVVTVVMKIVASLNRGRHT